MMSFSDKEIMNAAREAGIKLTKTDSKNNVVYPDGTEKYIDVRIKGSKHSNAIVENEDIDYSYDLTKVSSNLKDSFNSSIFEKIIYDTNYDEINIDLDDLLEPTHDLSSLPVHSDEELNYLNKSNNDFERAA